jgi:formylglycine-generating enzyme required for sulfatase activity
MGSPPTEQDRYADEGPRREVTISRPFYMGVCEVTQGQYEPIMGKNPSAEPHGGGPVYVDPQYPVGGLSWASAMEFCRLLSEKTGRTVTLPTEAQWEYACRAGTTTRYFYGDDPNYSEIVKYAWCAANNQRAQHAVGRLQPNPWGLYDMYGSHWEWCADWFADSYAGAENTDPAGPASGAGHVLRGGCWGNVPVILRTAYRYSAAKGPASRDFGFRVIMEWPGEPAPAK